MTALPKFVKAGMQSGSIMMMADVSTQFFIEGRKRQSNSEPTTPHYYDMERTLRWASAGLLLHGPYFYLSFSKLDRFMGGNTSFLSVVKKTALAQVVVFPPYLIMLFTYMGLWQTSDSNVLWNYVWNRVPDAFGGGCLFWPAVNIINFALVPSTLRVPYVAAVGSIW
eukprot:CAMPEP_0178908764 /NCGR_PEP_ID=MMETSP0786-20121207/8104_1 /TAXON_ID=186022 /ORGANISM="Thalassionema frauenfeldii, Strain CCMP 1798" /LENGTH=166 /DNA_ID=CAMNT_0020580703 /DNA_START=137 /DNA_END=634 /DNA_ORIENTATION=+